MCLSWKSKAELKLVFTREQKKWQETGRPRAAGAEGVRGGAVVASPLAWRIKGMLRCTWVTILGCIRAIKSGKVVRVWRGRLGPLIGCGSHMHLAQSQKVSCGSALGVLLGEEFPMFVVVLFSTPRVTFNGQARQHGLGCRFAAIWKAARVPTRCNSCWHAIRPQRLFSRATR